MIHELPGSDQDAQKPFGGPNPWPSADVLPAWKETMLKYQQEMINLGKAVARIIAVALDVNEDFFDQPNLLGNALSYYNFNHYVQYGASNKYTLGTLAHSDIFIITILATNDVPGLQICKNIDANPRVWENVLPLKGAFVINIGDMLQWMSNGLFRSTKHRVLFREERYSLACFVSPSLEGTIECIPSCKSAENPPKYPPIKCEEFIANVYKKRGDDQNISDHTKL
ncbi:2-oxoglutarate (2OG) and Fe(II)-dependent oxygenase superfamily protein [Melia azedarach]|uniref:2-oxoglutarate (2OG) and Fe(II)-dependent oxygenase superfamily protein n=1 Tax=Melia azedarach TaxID=155640 RepID=A0ACC1XR40_MELAZ|nr:2-oxoglutarate (2OG) and Fe(II)-dependent oxygenase superfamily protein [Melia azedarach]